MADQTLASSMRAAAHPIACRPNAQTTPAPSGSPARPPRSPARSWGSPTPPHCHLRRLSVDRSEPPPLACQGEGSSNTSGQTCTGTPSTRLLGLPEPNRFRRPSLLRAAFTAGESTGRLPRHPRGTHRSRSSAQDGRPGSRPTIKGPGSGRCEGPGDASAPRCQIERAVLVRSTPDQRPADRQARQPVPWQTTAMPGSRRVNSIQCVWGLALAHRRLQRSQQRV